MQDQFLLQCFHVPNDNFRLNFVLRRRSRTLSTDQHCHVVGQSHRGNLFGVTDENGLVVVVQILDDDVAANAVGEESTVRVPNEILSSVSVVTENRLKPK